MRRIAGHLLALFEAEQDRWFLWVPVCFGIGIAAYFQLPVEPALRFSLALPVVAFILARLWQRGVTALLIGGVLLSASLGFGLTKLRSDRVAAPVIARQIGPVAVTGWIELVEARPARGQRLTIQVVSIEGLALTMLPERVRVRTLTADATLKPGDAVSLKAVLSPPAGPALPGGFDFARSAWFQGLGGVGYAREKPSRVAIAKPVPFDLRWRSAIERVRFAIGARITAALSGETGHIANALITGERGGITDATNNAFRDSGLFHILSISGLHMVIMAGAVFMSVRFALTLWPRLVLNYPAKKWAAAAAALGALGYLLISGASFPTVRSYIMISIMFLAVLLDRPAVALRNVALAALLILAVYPESLIDVGFQMSFAAVVALVAAYEMLRDRERPDPAGGGRSLWRSGLLFFGGIVLSTLIASIAVAPLAAYHFHTSQQYAIVANLIAIPLCNAIVMPAALAALVAMPFGLEAWPLRVMGLGIEGMVWCAYAVARLPGAVGRIPEIPTLAFVLMVAGGLWICLWRRRWRYAGLVLVLAGAVVAPFRTAPDVLIGRDGLVAVRDANGLLSAIGPRNATFELSRMLEHEGDGRRPEEVVQGRAFRCDWSGCVAQVRGHTIAVERHPAAHADDCRRAALMVIPGRSTRGCGPSADTAGASEPTAAPTTAGTPDLGATRGSSAAPSRGAPRDATTAPNAGGTPDPGAARDPAATSDVTAAPGGVVDGVHKRGSGVPDVRIMDRAALARSGPVAINLSGIQGTPTSRLEVRTVAAMRGLRPWSRPPPRSTPPVSTQLPTQGRAQSGSPRPLPAERPIDPDDEP